MNDTQLLERLSTAYESVETPVPSAALAALMDAGGVASPEDDGRDAVVIPFARPRTRVRMRHLVAALVASFVAVSGLAAAGALPDALQRQVSSVVAHLGIDIPSPAPARGADEHHVPSSTNRSDRPASTPTSSGSSTKGTDGSVDAPAAGGTVAPATGSTPKRAPTTSSRSAGTTPGTTPGIAPATTTPSLGDVGTVDQGTPTTQPAASVLGLPPITLPQVTLPPVALPPVALPPITLPQVTLPQVTLPPITLPHITLPPILGL